MTSQENTSDKLGVAPIPKLILKMSLPAMLSMLTQAFYNIVDTIFVGLIPNSPDLAEKGEFLSDHATRALGIAMPFQALVLAFALGIAIGTSSMVSRKLGESKHMDANNAAQTGLLLALIFSAIFLASGYFLADGFMLLFAGRGTHVFDMGRVYLSIVTMCSVCVFIEVWLTRILQGVGKMIVPMIAQLVGAVTNIIFDPILILPWGANMGVAGAAVATVIGQAAAMSFTIIAVNVKRPEIKVFFAKGFKVRKDILFEIIRVGIPTAIMNAVASFTVMMMNGILMKLNEFAVNVLSYYFKLQSFVFMPVFGMNQGTLPILAYNYGACRKERFMKTYKMCLIISAGIMLLGLALFLSAPVPLLKIFSATQNSIEIGTSALRIISTSFVFASFTIITTSMFLAIGHGVKSMLLSMMRQVIVLLPVALLFSVTIGLSAVWWSWPIAEMITAAVFVPISIFTIKKVFRLKEEKELREKVLIESLQEDAKESFREQSGSG